MTFTDHLRELRDRLKKIVIVYVVCAFVVYSFSEWVFVWMAQPLLEGWGSGAGRPVLHFKSPVEPLFVYIKIALLGGLFLASPMIFYQLWRFVAPGLYAKERSVVLPFVLCSVLFFVGGAGFGYVVVFPVLFKFLLGFARAELGSMQEYLGGVIELGVDRPLTIEPTLMMEEYLALASKTLIGFGLCFELPILMTFLGVAGVVDHKRLLGFGRYAIVIIFVVSGIVTPDPTATTQALLAVPLVGLYYLGVLLVYFTGRKRPIEGQQ